MVAQIKDHGDYGFFLAFLGGIITIVMTLVGVIVYEVANVPSYIFIGSGYIGIFAPVTAAIIAIVIIGILAIIIGLKLFSKKIHKMFENWDLLILAIILIIFGLVVLGIGGLLILTGGILLIVQRAKNK
ncbi:MAG TPA: hypothetical protein VMX55_02240 [candidate division Zixibacteria bacterium]|nr:hypothetical protein [candidate division Zixibacteria bacterium]